MSNALNITIYQGCDFIRLLTLKSDANTPMNLTGFTFKGQGRSAFDSAVVFEFEFTVRNQTTNAGEVDWILPNDALTNLVLKASTKYIYDIEMISAGNIKTRIIQGTATVLPEVTKE